MSNYETIKICNSYLYSGEINEEFKNMFEYQIIEDKIYITDIKNNNGDISKYLYECNPVYIEINGWIKDVTNIKDVDKLPINCINYINLIQNLVNIPISLISVGPTKEDKVKVR